MALLSFDLGSRSGLHCSTADEVLPGLNGVEELLSRHNVLQDDFEACGEEFNLFRDEALLGWLAMAQHAGVDDPGSIGRKPMLCREAHQP